MKLEELLTKGSGSCSSSPVEQKVESKTKSTGDEVENADAAEESVEKESAGGKKKGTRKKRSLNWEEAERGLLLEVIKSKVEFVENRSVDAKSIKAKRLAWSQITKQFNALNFRHRMLEQIQVQWRSMKNSAKREYQQKHPKSDTLEGMRMIEFMEEMQKDPVSSRSQTRSGANVSNGPASVLKKELLEMDEDEDMPLAALPNSTNASEDTLQTSTIAIPSPPPSTAGGDSQQEGSQQQLAPARRKRAKPSMGNKTTAMPTENGKSISPRKRRQRNHSQAQSILSDDETATNSNQIQAAASSTLQQFTISSAGGNAQASNVGAAASVAAVGSHETMSSLEIEQKYKQELFKLLKQARLAEIDYARREHEQKLRFEQQQQEIKMNYYRQENDLKLRIMREEHDFRLRQQRREHEARLSAYSFNSSLNGVSAQAQPLVREQSPPARCNAKTDYNNIDAAAAQPSTSTEAALALHSTSVVSYN